MKESTQVPLLGPGHSTLVVKTEDDDIQWRVNIQNFFYFEGQTSQIISDIKALMKNIINSSIIQSSLWR